MTKCNSKKIDWMPTIAVGENMPADIVYFNFLTHDLWELLEQY